MEIIIIASILYLLITTLILEERDFKENEMKRSNK